MVGVPRQPGELPERRGTRLTGRLAAACLALALSACAGAAAAPAPAALELGRPSMGTVLEITVHARDAATARGAAEACFALAASLEAVFTTWDDASALSRLNAAAGSGPQPEPPELVRILADAKRFAALTGGAFDVTVGPLIGLWREAAHRNRMPTQAELAAARARVGAEGIALGEGTVALRAGMRVDLGGLAKGWALDRMGELLRARGLDRALLDFGGSSLLALGTPPDAPAWRVAVEDGRGGIAGVLELRDQSASVSGSFGTELRVAGRRLGHVIDPASALPVDAPATAIAVAADGATAEALSTALLVLGPVRGPAMVEAVDGAEALLLDAAGARHVTSGWERAVRFVPAGEGPGPVDPRVAAP